MLTFYPNFFRIKNEVANYHLAVNFFYLDDNDNASLLYDINVSLKLILFYVDNIDMGWFKVKYINKFITGMLVIFWRFPDRN